MLAWLQSVDDADLHLASVTLGEIQAGIEQAVLMFPCSIRSNGVLDLLEQQQQVPSEAAGLLGFGVQPVVPQSIGVSA